MPRRHQSREEQLREARRRYDFALDALEESTSETEVAHALVDIGAALNELLAAVRSSRRARRESASVLGDRRSHVRRKAVNSLPPCMAQLADLRADPPRDASL